jgi:hypothetical protein
MKTTLLILALVLLAIPASALDYGQDVTPDVIFGSGNANGHFTVHSNSHPAGDTLELGLRAKVRHNASGFPENTFNDFAPGEYYHLAGVAPTQSFPTATWSFEWTVNTDATGLGNYTVGDFTYELGLDTDPGPGTSYVTFDPITPPGDGTFADHAMGDNSTANGGGVTATSEAEYMTFLDTYNVAQNSWKYHWFVGSFDPTTEGIYDIYLKAIGSNGVTYGHTHIQVHVGYGEPVATESQTLGHLKSFYR